MVQAKGRNPRLALGYLAVAVLLAMAPWFSTAAVLPQLRAEWHLTASQGAWLTIAVQLGFVAGAVASAILNLADLVKPRWLLMGGGLAAAAVNLGLINCHGFGAAMPLRFLTGVFLALVYPPAMKLMSTWFLRGRGTALGVMVGALNLGSALPHLVNGLGGAAWRPGMITTSGLTALGGLLGGALGREGPFPFSRARFDPKEIGKVFAERRVRLACLGYCGHMWELYAMWSWIGVYLLDRFTRAGGGDPRQAAALATFAVIGIGAVGCWYGGWVGDRRGYAFAAALSMALSGACALVMGWMAAPLAAVLAVALFWGFWVPADSAQFSAMVTEYADPRYVGTALTGQLGIGFTLSMATVWLIPVLRLHAGWGWAMAALAPGPALGVWAMRALLRAPRAIVS